VYFVWDGVLSTLNNDLGSVGSIQRYHWNPGAQRAVQAVTDAGFHAFIVTNQSGGTRGYSSENDLQTLHRSTVNAALASGGTIDDARYGAIEANDPVGRKNLARDGLTPSVILDLASKWEIDVNRSFLVASTEPDIKAAEEANIPGHLFSGGDVYNFVCRLLDTPRPSDISFAPM
jgi:histidinol phosphatase-like enzyme